MDVCVRGTTFLPPPYPPTPANYVAPSCSYLQSICRTIGLPVKISTLNEVQNICFVVVSDERRNDARVHVVYNPCITQEDII